MWTAVSGGRAIAAFERRVGENKNMSIFAAFPGCYAVNNTLRLRAFTRPLGDRFLFTQRTIERIIFSAVGFGTACIRAAVVGPPLTERRALMQWTRPEFTDLRFGFEITLYIASR